MVSLLVHAALIARVPVDFPEFKLSGERETDQPLVVRLAPPFIAAPPAPPSQPVAPPSRPVAKAPRDRPRAVPPPKAEAAPPAAPVLEAPASDLSAYIAERRRARGVPEEPVAKPPATAPVEDENTRANRIAMANLASARQMTFGYDPSKSGGVFEVTHTSLDYGEFLFYGWNDNVGRRTKQLIEVRRGSASDIRLVIVRKMIEIIRQHEPVEFVWDSDRLGRSLVLSSRLRDNSGLEDFMMMEFFGVKR